MKTLPNLSDFIVAYSFLDVKFNDNFRKMCNFVTKSKEKCVKKPLKIKKNVLFYSRGR